MREERVSSFFRLVKPSDHMPQPGGVKQTQVLTKSGGRYNHFKNENDREDEVVKNLSRILSCLLIGILSVSLLAGCSGSSTDSEDDAEDNGDTAAAAEEDAGTEDAETSTDYTTLTISTYDVDTYGDQELTKTEVLDEEGNVQEVYEKGSIWYGSEEEEYEYTISYSYNSDGLISGYTKEYIDPVLLYDVYDVCEETAEYEYQYNANGSLAEIESSYSITAEFDYYDYSDSYSSTTVCTAEFIYDTEGNVSQINIWEDHVLYDEDGIEYKEESGYSSDSFSGLSIDLVYDFDEITGIDIYQGQVYNGLRINKEPYSILLEYSSSGLIDVLESQDEGYPPYYSYDLNECDELGYQQLFYRVLEYIDFPQGSQLVPFGSCLLYGDCSDTYGIINGNYNKMMLEYDSLGNKTKCCFYDEDGDLEIKYTYEYEYDEYDRISAVFTEKDHYDLGEVAAVSYYETYYEYE